MTSREWATLACIWCALGWGMPGCGASLETGRADGLDPAALPEPVRADYDLFARRCSKCHSLARPLQSGITSDTFWAAYVERMRRQPGSGIAPQEVPRILRFLHFYTARSTDGTAASTGRDGGDER